MSNNCGKCKGNASNRELLRCFGGCKKAFHPGCIDNFKVDQWGKFFKDCPFAKFICMDCQNSEAHNFSQISMLKDSLKDVINSVNELSAKVDSKFNEININMLAVDRHSQHASTSLAGELGSVNANVSTYAQIVGTGDTSDAIQTVAVKKNQYLYVSHLHPSTVAENMRSYVSSKLNMTLSDIDCWPLIPKNRDVNSLNFISFKVGLPEDVFERTLAPEFWPTGTSIRRFIINNRQKNSNFPVIPNGT